MAFVAIDRWEQFEDRCPGSLVIVGDQQAGDIRWGPGTDPGSIPEHEADRFGRFRDRIIDRDDWDIDIALSRFENHDTFRLEIVDVLLGRGVCEDIEGDFQRGLRVGPRDSDGTWLSPFDGGRNTVDPDFFAGAEEVPAGADPGESDRCVGSSVGQFGDRIEPGRCGHQLPVFQALEQDPSKPTFFALRGAIQKSIAERMKSFTEHSTSPASSDGTHSNPSLGSNVIGS